MKRIISAALFALLLMLSLSVLFTQSVVAGEENNYIVKTLEYYDGELPASYRNEDIGEIENQGRHGDCWAFSTLATLQINMKKMGFVNSESENGFFDFSEAALAYFSYGYTCTECYGKNIDFDDDGKAYCLDCGSPAEIVQPNTRFNSYNDAGGYMDLAISSIISAPVLIYEDDWTFNTYFPSTSLPDNFSEIVTDFKVLSVKCTNNVDELKRMIYSYGAAIFCFNCSEIFYSSYVDDSTEDTYYTYWTNDFIEGRHAVSAIGYDDNFSRLNFKIDRKAIITKLKSIGKIYGACLEFVELLDKLDIPYGDNLEDPNFVQDAIDYITNMNEDELIEKYAPKSDGAVLLKNSWGTFSASTTGLMWVPYEYLDLWMLDKTDIFSFDSVSYGNPTDKEYDHDDFGALAFRKAVCVADSENVDKFEIANIYDFETASNIKYVSFFSLTDREYECSIYYAPFSNGNIVQSQKTLLATETVTPNDFYVSVGIDSDLTLPAGTGAIIIDFPTNENLLIGIKGCETEENEFCSVCDVNDSRVNQGNGFETCVYNDYYYSFVIKVGTNDSDTASAFFPADYTEYNSLKETIVKSEKYYTPDYYEGNSLEAFLLEKSDYMNIDTSLDVWSQDVIDNAVVNMNKAYEALIPLKANYYKHKQITFILSNLQLAERNYTEVSWQNFINAYLNFKELPTDLTVFEQAKVDSAVTNLLLAIANLKPYVDSEYEDLLQKYNDAEASLSDALDALEKANNELQNATDKSEAEKFEKTVSALQSEIDRLTAELQKSQLETEEITEQSTEGTTNETAPESTDFEETAKQTTGNGCNGSIGIIIPLCVLGSCITLVKNKKYQ